MVKFVFRKVRDPGPDLFECIFAGKRIIGRHAKDHFPFCHQAVTERIWKCRIGELPVNESDCTVEISVKLHAENIFRESDIQIRKKIVFDHKRFLLC